MDTTAEYSEVTSLSEQQQVTEAPSTHIPEAEGEAVETSLYTSVSVSDTTSDELLKSVRNIEQIQLYQFGILLVTIAVFLSTVIIKTFFGKEL